MMHGIEDSGVYFIRTADHIEVDIVIDRGTHKEWIEIKKSATFRPKMASAIKKFINGNDKGFVLYQGEEFIYTDNIKAIHYSDYLK